MEPLSKAWDIYSKDFGPWFVFGLVFAVIAAITATVLPVVGGLITLPLAMRETIRAVEGQRSPTVAGMFDFSNLGDDLLTSFLMVAAQYAGLFLCLIGWPIAWMGFFFAPELVADGRVGGMDAMKLSWRYVTSNLGPSLIVALIGFGIAAVSSSIIIGIFFTLPLILLMYACHFLAVREQIYADAQAAGITLKPRITG
ncbi:MAG: hypothetical protein GY913_07015 [Proteobacteria bacterium]|nr:hypothetical protein [Pseudomonadota bacterium]MCP4916658.1 hypothetical protein [Pseudomonadota bacterium]